MHSWVNMQQRIFFNLIKSLYYDNRNIFTLGLLYQKTKKRDLELFLNLLQLTYSVVYK